MENQDTTNSINFLSIIKTDAWVSIFHSISRLITVEEDLNNVNVVALQKLYDLAEEVEARVLGIPSSEKPKFQRATLLLDQP